MTLRLRSCPRAVLVTLLLTAAPAARSHNAALGDIAVVVETDADAWFDFGEWKSKVASRKNQDGTSTCSRNPSSLIADR